MASLPSPRDLAASALRAARLAPEYAKAQKANRRLSAYRIAAISDEINPHMARRNSRQYLLRLAACDILDSRLDAFGAF